MVVLARHVQADGVAPFHKSRSHKAQDRLLLGDRELVGIHTLPLVRYAPEEVFDRLCQFLIHADRS